MPRLSARAPVALVALAVLAPLAGAQDGGAEGDALLASWCGLERELAPGAASVVEMTLRNDGALATTVSVPVAWDDPLAADAWRVDSLDAEPSRLLAPGGSATFRFRVTAPDAPDAPQEATLVFPFRAPYRSMDGGDPAVRWRVDASGSGSGGGLCDTRVLSRVQIADLAPLDAATLAAGAAVAAGGAVAVAGGAAVARSEDRRYRLLAPLAGLFTRFARPDVLKQATRDRVYRVVADEPGVHLAAIRDRLGIPLSVVVYHLRMLERHGLVTSRREGRYRRFFVAGAAPAARPLPLLTPLQSRLVALLEARGEIGFQDAMRELGVTKQVLSYNVKALADAHGLEVARSAGAGWVVRRRATSR